MVALSADAWWLSLEPLGDDVAWALTRARSSGAGAEPVGAGLIGALGELQREVATALPGHRGHGLWSGPWVDPVAERRLAVRLGRTLLPPALRDALATGDGTAPPTVWIATRGWLAQVPWDALAVDDDGAVRLVEVAQVVGGLPATVVSEARDAVTCDGAVLRVVDPGPTRHGRLYPATPDAWWDRCADDEDVLPLPGRTLDADGLSRALRLGPRRFVYFGHAVGGSPDAPAAAGMVLTAASGDADVLSAYRWLGEPERYPCPSRLAIIACGSDDGAHIEQSGLPVAAVRAGARLVTVTRWTLPVAPGRGDACPTTRLGLAVDTAHAQDGPVAALRQWQIRRLRAWRGSGARDDAPLLWASLVTYVVPEGVA